MSTLIKVIARTILAIYYLTIAVAAICFVAGVISVWPIFLASFIIVMAACAIVGLFVWAKNNA